MLCLYLCLLKNREESSAASKNESREECSAHACDIKREEGAGGWIPGSFPPKLHAFGAGAVPSPRNQRNQVQCRVSAAASNIQQHLQDDADSRSSAGRGATSACRLRGWRHVPRQRAATVGGGRAHHPSVFRSAAVHIPVRQRAAFGSGGTFHVSPGERAATVVLTFRSAGGPF